MSDTIEEVPTGGLPDLPQDDTDLPGIGDMEAENLLLRPIQTSDLEQTESTTGPTNIRPASIGALYVSHLLSTLNTRIFEFGAILFLARLLPGGLLEVSIYAIIRSTAAIAFAPSIGTYIDNANRKTAVYTSIWTQRLATCFSCGLFGILSLDHFFYTTLENEIKSAILGLLCLLAGVEKLGSILNLVSIERDWVPVIASDDPRLLGRLNAQMRRIDLCCKLFGPLAIGWLDAWSIRGALIFTAAVNIMSVSVELLTINMVYRSCANLAACKTTAGTISHNRDLSRISSCLSHIRGQGRAVLQQLTVYFTSAAVKPSFALSLLYCTVLSFNGQMVAFLSSSGENSGSIATYRMISILAELSATWLGPRLMDRIGAIRAGSWSINFQLFCLSITTLAFWYNWTGNAAAALIAGVVLSRAGLWAFDLAAQLLIQEDVEEDRRGSFSATEAMFQNVFELISFASTLVFNKPEQFRYPVLMSVVAVILAAVLYASFVRQRRGHLIHMRCFPDSKSQSDRNRGHGPVARPEYVLVE